MHSHRIRVQNEEPVSGLQFAYEHVEWQWICILEDDFTFSFDPEEVSNALKKVFDEGANVDVILLACNPSVLCSQPSNFPCIHRVQRSITSSELCVR